jgi:hypothetical protein
MSDLNVRIDEAMEVHFSKHMAYEIKEDFPMLRLYKSTWAYRMIATFQTIPLNRRMEAGRAVVPSIHPKSEKEKVLRESFYRRMNSNTLAELNAMSFDPSELELELSPSYDMQSGDEFVTLLRTHEEKLSKGEIRDCFVGHLRESYESSLKTRGRKGLLYEATSTLEDWNLNTKLDFGGGYQFNCEFILRRDRFEKEFSFSSGSFYGYGDVLGWDDVSRETLDQDAKQAVQLCICIRRFLFDIVSDVG